jgi:hypothetical protein
MDENKLISAGTKDPTMHYSPLFGVMHAVISTMPREEGGRVPEPWLLLKYHDLGRNVGYNATSF